MVSGASSATRTRPPKPAFPGLRLFYSETRLVPGAPAAIERNRIGVAHLLKSVRHQGGSKTAAAIKNQGRRFIGNLGFDVPLNHAFAHVNGALRVALVPFAVLARIDQDVAL